MALENPKLGEIPARGTGAADLREQADAEDRFAAQGKADRSLPRILQEALDQLNLMGAIPLRDFRPLPVELEHGDPKTGRPRALVSKYELYSGNRYGFVESRFDELIPPQRACQDIASVRPVIEGTRRIPLLRAEAQPC